MKPSRKSKSVKSRSVSRAEPSPEVVKPHRVENILNAYFKDVLSARTETRSGDHTKGAIIKCTSENNGDAAVEETLSSFKNKLELYDTLERHIQHAQAKALAEEEQNLSRLKEEYPNFDNSTIMKQPSRLSAHLDESLLKEHGLLPPSECLPAVPTRNYPPREGVPSYLNSTLTFDKHARVRQPVVNWDEKDKTASLPTRKNNLSSEEMENEKAALSELQRRLTFLHNPRYSAHKHTNTASHGPAKVKGNSKEKEKDLRLFAAEPRELVFTDYKAGESYEKIIEFRNISGASRQLRIVPPKSPYFKAKIAHFPNPEGVIAPGMTCSYSVQFLPDSLADFDDQLKVLGQNGECLTVGLKGFRPHPDLSLPPSLHCGHCLVGGRVSVTFPCLNSGGDGNFKLRVKEQGDELSLQDGILEVGNFVVSPMVFHLGPGESIDIEIDFHPDSAGDYSSDFLMVCDNGQVNSFTLTGTGDMLSVGCVHVTPSATSLYTAMEYAKSSGHTPNMDPLADPKEEDMWNCVSKLVVDFKSTNPGAEMNKVVVIRNYSGVKLSYQWLYYHPCTELSSSGSASISPRVPVAALSPFILEPGCDNKELLPGETKLIPVVFKPSKEGESHLMAYMELEGIPLSSFNPNEEGWSWIRLDSNRVAIMCLELLGVTKPYQIELDPPLLSLPEELPACTETRRNFKIHNHSIGPVTFQWSSTSVEQCLISVDPPMGSIVSGGCQYCECVISVTSEPGPFSVTLECSVSHDDNGGPFLLHVKGKAQGPVVSVGCPSLQYGLMQLGHTSSKVLTLTNESMCTANFELKQATASQTESEREILDYKCLSFSSSAGDVPPGSSVNVEVVCGPVSVCGRLRSAVELLVNEKTVCFIPVSAEVQSPSLVLEQASVYLESCYKGITNSQQLVMTNRGLIPAQYHWIDHKYDHCQLEFSPRKGVVGPKESINVTLKSKWNTEGYHTGVLAVCEIDSVSEPLVLSISSKVAGLTITYSVEGQTEECNNSSPLKLDFGTSNPIGLPKVLKLVVSNCSAMQTSLSVCVKSFKASALRSTYTPNQPSRKNNSTRALLSSTRNISDPQTRTMKQTQQDISESLLSEGRGCCFTVSPSQSNLPPFQSCEVIVTAYSDMWGQYTDQLVCKVDGVEPRIFPIRYEVVGCPVMFQTTATYGKTVVRFGNHPAGSRSVHRTLKLFNYSSSNIRLDWRVFNLLPDDEKLIDLISFIGEPFPLLLNRGERTEQQQQLQEVELEEEESDLSSPLIRVVIQPHEGLQAPGYPFTIQPQQMVIPAKGHSSVTITFDPSIKSFNELGQLINSYILGYCSLDDQSPAGCVRHSGYNVKPVRIDITAAIHHPKLVIETDIDDNTLTFVHQASELFQEEEEKTVILPSITVTHHFSLTNPTDAIITFQAVPHPSPPYTICLGEHKEVVTLRPREAIKGKVDCSIEHQWLIKQEPTRTLSIPDCVTIQFSTGAIQKFPLTTVFHLPHLSIHPTVLDYGIVHLTQFHTASMQLRNESNSLGVWKASVPTGYDQIFQITPYEGILGTTEDQDHPWVAMLAITFIPKSEIKYSVEVFITELITQSCVVLHIKGSGSADQGVERSKIKRTHI